MSINFLLQPSLHKGLTNQNTDYRVLYLYMVLPLCNKDLKTKLLTLCRTRSWRVAARAAQDPSADRHAWQQRQHRGHGGYDPATAGACHVAAADDADQTGVGIYCDHDPGLVGIVGGGYVASSGGRRIVPTVAAVLALLPRVPVSRRAVCPRE